MFYAESEGFEPPEPFSSTVFKTAAIDHSANSPCPLRNGIAKIDILCNYAKFFFMVFPNGKNISYSIVTDSGPTVNFQVPDGSS